MGDSDEEHDRRRSSGRDKFRGERNDYDNAPPRRSMSHHRGGYDRGGRGPPQDRRGGGRDFHRAPKRDYYQSRDREMGGGGGGRGSPPIKRPRENNFNPDHGSWRGGHAETPPGDISSPATPAVGGGAATPTAPLLPAVMSFKEFVLKQEDDISEEEATQRYREYKIEFKRTQINDFFVLHKDEEWFKEKYHPVDSIARSAEVRLGLKKRCRVFIELLDAGYVDRVSLEISNAGEVMKFLDRVLIKLDGGSDKQLEELDSEESNQNQTKKEEEPAEPIDPATEPKPEVEEPAEKVDYKYEVDEGVGSEGEGEPAPPGADDEEPLAPPGMEEDAANKADADVEAEAEKKEEVKEEDGEDEEEDVNINILHRGSLSFLFTENAEKPSADEKKDTSMEESSTDPAVDPPTDAAPLSYDGSQMKRPLSLFMRSLPPAITRQDLTDVCKRYPGFLRVAMADPQPDRRYFRLGWATFDSTVNIKDICWNLSNIRIKDNDLSPSVNKEVVNRVRPVTGLTYADVAMQLDFNLAAKVVKRLDAKHKLYAKEETNGINGVETKQEDGEPAAAAAAAAVEDSTHVELPAENPVFSSLMSEGIETLVDCTIDDNATEENKIVQNDTLAQALDKILLYLRVVHCIDYYNGNNYPYEDEMPARCGIIHVRDTMPETTTKQSVHDWHKSNAEKIELLSQDDSFATEEDAHKLGLKDDEIEVNNFVKANTQELAKDKWLCPLSGKKFRGPDFIKKHIFNKHVDSIDNVKAEVKYFNSYVRDLRRPCFPDVKPQRSAASSGQQVGLASMNTPTQSHTPSPAGRNWTPRQPGAFASPRPPFTPQYNQPANNGADGYGRINTYPPKPVRRDQQRRPVIKYKDLDAPDEGDFF